MSPMHLRSNQPAARFYQGGSKIRSFRTPNGKSAEGDRVPEDWVGSTTTIFNGSPTGLTTLPDGNLLKDTVEADPLHWLGREHVERFGSDTKILVKLLDAGQRLPVHIHPERAFAAHHLQRQHGKAEAWYILDGGSVHLGFNRDVSTIELESWVNGQNVEAMLAAMHEVPVSAGDSVYVPPGLPHAIGAGVFLVEVQEPEDLSILLEWKDFAIDGRNEGHLGLGFETALQAADRRGHSESTITKLIVRQGSGTFTLARGSEDYFRAESYTCATNLILDPGFSIVVVTSGDGSLTTHKQLPVPVSKGDTLLVAHNDGTLEFDGELSFVRCRPPVSSSRN